MKKHSSYTRYAILISGILILISCLQSTSRNQLKPEKDQPGSLRDNPVLKVLDSVPPFHLVQNKWVDSVFNSMTEDERIGQLFMVAAYSKNGTTPNDKISGLIREQKIGGLIFMQGGPGRQAILTNYYQSISEVPLMIGIDGEWGLAMRLDSTMKFPWQMTLGAVQDNQLIYDMGGVIADQCRRIGVHVNFAPVVDINNNRNNPVIGARSFGEDRENVTEKGLAYMKGMQDHGVLATAKHFPGHGDTDKDSHQSLPVIGHDRARLDSVELYPYRKLIANGLGSVMVAHLSIPALDPTPNTPTTLSRKVVTELLQEKMRFKGLIFTDALNMKGVADADAPGIVDVKALLAGNDILLFSGDVPTAIAQIKTAIKNGEITQQYVDDKCRKILKAKYWMGLNKRPVIPMDKLYEDLHTKKAEVVLRRLVEASLTLVKNEKNLVPLQNLDTLQIASVSVGNSSPTVFQKRLGDYSKVDHFFVGEEPTTTETTNLLVKLKNYNTVIISLHKSNDSPFKGYKFSSSVKTFIKTVNSQKTVVLAVFANPYSLTGFEEALSCESVIMSYQDSELAQDYTAQLIFGGIPAKGKLPVSINANYPAGHGLISEKPIRMKYTIPEDLGMDSRKFDRINEIVEKAIHDTVFPGCQILAARNGMIFYREAFGHFTYDKKKAVSNDDLYDIASVTKVSSTLPSVMKLTDEGKIDISQTLGSYLPQLTGTDKYNVKLIDLLTHQAGFKSWIPFHLYTMTKDRHYRQGIYDTVWSELYSLPVADHLFANHNLPDTMFAGNIATPLSGKKKYLYSDLGFYYLKRMIENLSGKSLDRYTEDNFYRPLGATTLTYNPLKKFPKDRIAPTENDTIFRKQQIQGYVHDQGAAMMGGVGGHAGLFASSNDLAKLMQLYLNMGEYGGRRYIKESTMKEFTKCQFCVNGNRRAIGFDKPSPDGDGNTACDCVSYLSFGHSGFTGTLAWVDPDKQLVYIFLSNRVYPNAENKKLLKEGQRALIQEIFYDAL